MDYWDLIVLSVVQGLTEFLPVSSSGHLLAVRILFGISDENGVALDAFLHLGTLSAVLVYYWRVWWKILRGAKNELAVKLAVATVPAAAAGYLWQDVMAGYLRSAQTLGVALLVTAAVLWAADRMGEWKIKRAGMKDAVIIGLWQILALIPGVSRSGVTIAGGRFQGLSRHQAANFSFLLSAPIIAGAGVNSLPQLLGGNYEYGLGFLLLGFILAFASGLMAIAGLMKMVRKVSFAPFVVYLIGLAGVVFWYG